MKTIISCIYFLGAIVFGLCITYLDVIPALVTTLVTPILLLQIAEMSGVVRVHQPPKATTPIELALQDNLTDEEALDRFGWSMIVEMDQHIENTKTTLAVMQKSRDEMAAMHKKEAK